MSAQPAVKVLSIDGRAKIFLLNYPMCSYCKDHFDRVTSQTEDSIYLFSQPNLSPAESKLASYQSENLLMDTFAQKNKQPINQAAAFCSFVKGCAVTTSEIVLRIKTSSLINNDHIFKSCQSEGQEYPQLKSKLSRNSSLLKGL